jgi:hypothetical protein
LTTKENRKVYLKGLIALFLLSLAGYLIVVRLTREPDFFEQRVAQLRTNKYINSKVGDFQTSTYNLALFKNANNKAKFDVDLYGLDDTLSLNCVMVKHKGEWILAYFKRNNLKQK